MPAQARCFPSRLVFEHRERADEHEYSNQVLVLRVRYLQIRYKSTFQS